MCKLGDVIANGNAYPTFSTILVEAMVKKATVHPIAFQQVWNSSEVTFWKMIAPIGFKCLGDVATTLAEPPQK